MIQTDLVRPLQNEPTIALNVGDSTLILEIVCPQCRGAHAAVCSYCGGKKVVPTPEGARLLAFLKHHQE